jgi:hypothetical protein
MGCGYGPALLASLSQLLMAHTSSPSSAKPLAVSAQQIRELDLTPLASLSRLSPPELVRRSGTISLRFTWPRPAEDPRELSEIAEVRLWSLYADASYPWLPLMLERSSGELTRHVAMLLPHAFSNHEGIRFVPESLELWMTHRLFLLDGWANAHGLNLRQGLGQMAAVLGYDLDPSFWVPLPRP